MNKDDVDCRQLTAQTAAVLNNDIVLQKLFVSTQTNNLELSIQYSITGFIFTYFNTSES